MSSNPSVKDVSAFNDRYVLGKDKCEGSTRFLRIKIPNGKVTAEQFKAIAALSKEYGRGYAEITDRQNIQLHWVDPEKALEIFAKLDAIGFSTDHGGQGIPTASCGDVRAIVSCPAAGIDPEELVDTLPIVKRLDGFFNGNRDFLNMPRKFKVAISGCHLNCGNPEIHDLSFVAVKKQPNEVGFAVLAGGTIATAPQLGKPLNVIVKPEKILPVARATAEIFRDLGSRETKAKARFRWLVDAWGTQKLRKAIEEKIGETLETYPMEHLPVCLGEHVGVQHQKQKGYTYINIPVISGVLSSERMVEIARIAQEYGNGDLRLTPFQNILLAGIRDMTLEVALTRIEDAGYKVDGSYFNWTTISCAGNFCGKTIVQPKKDAAQVLDHLETRFGGKLKDVKLRLGFSGCSNGCARHLIADIGLQGSALTVEGQNVPAYNLYIKDATGGIALGKLVQKGIETSQVKFALANLIEAYVSNGKAVGFSEFCHGKSSEELLAIINEGRT